MTPRHLVIFTVAALLAVAVIVAPWRAPSVPASAPARAAATTTAPARPAALELRGEDARAATAVRRLIGAIRKGDVEALCRPGVVLTPAVVDALNLGGETCEADAEAELSANPSKGIALLGLETERDMATARVRAAGGGSVPLTLLRDGHRWLVSFSHGGDPISALTA